ncbi:uncharacterized protein Z520_10902 [Fonsecaea multimorphosa CBS 102226]|uniref:EF-hand domain-containing protein n=1 Tax=Fonsecaea multimorphosa CBS 102226 TaxID=1442371 RepID=A0A0D2JJV2_9EURO|nr:uncharacterized protein Z520_10902 [Fonsecaea multimorphosa CBS 102226]KIX93482.1 hypothetical protein Z520_10902 [Fonsecaea multimorphosa CBS 102226]OAL18655.1 hypothetical protein AYO22_10474 [Fonsecaea multimorphosa]
MILQSIISLFFLLALPGTFAKCCREDSGGDCGDNSVGTPCCGYKACNAFCCSCLGVSVIGEIIDKSTTEWTSVITAPYDSVHSTFEQWTCRASHITTWYPPPTKRALPEDAVTNISNSDKLVATITEKAQPTWTTALLHSAYNQDALVELEETFDFVSKGEKRNGTSIITLEQYFGFFNVSSNGTQTVFGKFVEAKFRAHDKNGDGLLTVEEAQLLCDSDGCY